MKLIAIPAVVAVTVLMSFPVLFTNGDGPLPGCGTDTEIGAALATIRSLESGGDFTAHAAGSSASGAYQFTDTTWNGYGGYPQAWQAPPEVQDRNAVEHVQQILDTNDGDITAVPVVWYLGHLPVPGSTEWDTVPDPAAGNTLTPRQYQQRWMTEYERQLTRTTTTNATPATDISEAASVVSEATPATSESTPATNGPIPITSESTPLTSESMPVASVATPAGGCLPGTPIDPLADGYAYPAPYELFASAAVDEPHHDYPAWDWMIPEGTPVYAVRGGRVITVQDWPYNWWDHGCGQNATDCHTCGIGVTIEDDNGNHWTYCHADNIHVHLGDTVTAGTQILNSGNTGRSSGPHLHIQISTADGQLRCPQPLMRSLRDHATGIDPTSLPTTGCYYPAV